MAYRYSNAAVSSAYRLYRPNYPFTIVQNISNFWEKSNIAKCHNKPELIIDIGCGSGQLTKILSPYANKVIGVDISDTQINEAVQESANYNNVEYKLGRCEELPFPDENVDIITVAQAVHWFDHQAFNKEVDRCLRPGGCLALIGYSFATVHKPDFQGKIDKMMQEYYFGENFLGGAWPEVRRFLDDEFRSIPLPYENVNRYDTYLVQEYTAKTFLGYLMSMGVYRSHSSQYPDRANIAESLIQRILELLGIPDSAMDTKMKIRWPLFLVMCAKPGID